MKVTNSRSKCAAFKSETSKFMEWSGPHLIEFYCTIRKLHFENKDLQTRVDSLRKKLIEFNEETSRLKEKLNKLLQQAYAEKAKANEKAQSIDEDNTMIMKKTKTKKKKTKSKSNKKKQERRNPQA